MSDGSKRYVVVEFLRIAVVRGGFQVFEAFGSSARGENQSLQRLLGLLVVSPINVTRLLVKRFQSARSEISFSLIPRSDEKKRRAAPKGENPSSVETNNQLTNLGANIRRERMAKGITQERLAEATGLNIRNIQKIEAGETNILITTAIRIRKALGCSAEKLIPRE